MAWFAYLEALSRVSPKLVSDMCEWPEFVLFLSTVEPHALAGLVHFAVFGYWPQ